ncbi:putative E3 ubiquitin ligase SUD1 [Cinnamomum micranthum f. kanehirae]|uniref:RING-type E3 ubiquitin transferase n=1 Tax=Cinnamomum micranthum f. kanehirae TaxID=337451 RepID=A0A3S3NYB7_9MAGN|nr:putative E3 ubiquitin ligase SUD1 [Cinnamomum micranthum f. kanehirae]
MASTASTSHNDPSRTLSIGSVTASPSSSHSILPPRDPFNDLQEVSSSLSSSSSHRNGNHEEDDEEGDVCRICRNPGDADNPLSYPCACSGSIKFVHEDCLLQWLNHSNKRQCEVCKHAFSFSPLYADNAPARLPFQEFVVGIAMKACRILQLLLRLAFVLSVWLLIIPFITFWMWRLTFVRSLGEAQTLFFSHKSVTLVFQDCLHGFLLSAGIVFIFLGATSLRDYFRHLRELGGQEAERGDDGHDRHGARAVRRPPGPANRVQGGDGDGEDAGAEARLIRRNAENVAARLEVQAARLEAHVEQMFEGLDDADAAEDVPFDELVGMQGPVFHLVENAITVLASNAIFLGVVILLPFSIGRIVLYYISWFFSNSASVLSTAMPPTGPALSLANTTVKSALTAATNLSSGGYSKDILGDAAEVVAEALNATGLDEVTSSVSRSVLANLSKGMVFGASRLSDLATLYVGYVFIFCVVFFYLGLVALIRYTRGERLIMGRLYGIASIADSIQSLIRQFLAGMKHLMTVVKVAFLLVIELGVFPLMCGWWLDVCTIRMLGTTIAQRVEFFSVAPLASSLIHWLVGIVYMLQISIFVSLLRGVLRNGVLFFLRDPADPNYNPFRDLIDDPVHRHARRVLLSVAVYGSLIVMLVFLPVKLAMRLAPSVFPLDISVSDPITEIPADILLFQIFIPFAIEHFKPRMTIKAVLHQWFTAVGWALGLTDFLLPRPEDNDEPDNGNPEPARQDRLRGAHRGGAVQQDRELVPLVPAEEERLIHATGNMDVAEESDGDDQADAEYAFVFRIVLLLVLAWMTLLLFNSALIVFPISLGRALFNAIPHFQITHGIKCNDLYTFNIGCYIIWTAVAGARYSIEYLKTRRAGDLLVEVWKWCAIFAKSSALLSLWIFVIPVLIGLLFELLLVFPMRVRVDESPVFLLYQDWALGLVFLKIWTRAVMMDQMAPFMNESWRLKFERVREDGFSRLQGLWVLREIVVPIMMKLLTALCVPYVFARGIFPVLGYPLIVNSAVYRFAWLGCLLFGLTGFCIKRFHIWFTNLHNSIRDDRYLIGRRLHNFGEDTVDESNTAEIDRGTRDATLHARNEQGADIGLRLRGVNGQNLQQERLAA